MKPKVAICTPMHGDAKAGYVDSLAGLLLAASKEKIDLRYFRVSSNNAVRARNELVRLALEWGADHLLWLDTDQTFPAYTLKRLLSVGQPIVGCNIATRTDPPRPTARDKTDRPVFTHEDLALRGIVQDVGFLGLGVLLTAAEVFDKLPQPWFQMPNVRGTIIGEDHYFCRQARAAGYSLYVDHALSARVGLIGEREYRIEQALPEPSGEGMGQKG